LSRTTSSAEDIRCLDRLSVQSVDYVRPPSRRNAVPTVLSGLTTAERAAFAQITTVLAAMRHSWVRFDPDESRLQVERPRKSRERRPRAK